MRNLLPVLCLALLPSTAAFATGDLAVTSLTADRTTVQTGEAVRFTVQVRNNGPDSATDINLDLRNNYAEPMYPVSATPPAGWQCSAMFSSCWTGSMPAGTEVSIESVLLIPAIKRPSPPEFRVTAHVTSGSGGNPDDNRKELTLTLQPSSHVADLSISISAPPNPFPEDAPLTLAYDVRNNGPQDLSNVRVAFYAPVDAVVSGPGWSCENAGTGISICARPGLAANANAPLTARIGPLAPVEFEARAEVYAAQTHFDENLSNNRAWRTVFVGDAANWGRILVPLGTRETPGAGSSLWITEIMAVIDAESHPPMAPDGCGGLEDPCARPPLNRAFDAFDEDLVVPVWGPQFLYVAKEHLENVRVSTRVYDASKSEATAGAFVPMPRDDDFSERGFSIVGVPVAAQFRSMLRIYDASGTEDGKVDFALFADEASQPFHVASTLLGNEEPQAKVTTALLPRFPSYAQIDLSPLIPPGTSHIRVLVQARESGMKLWGFVSITNNETSHVTVAVP